MASDGSFSVKVKHNKDKLDVTLTSATTVGELKGEVEKLTCIPADAMKLTAAKVGLLSDNAKTAADLGFTAKTVFMVTGTPAAEAAETRQLKKPSAAALESSEVGAAATPFCEQLPHSRVLASGPPESPEFDAVKGAQMPLPVDPGTRVPYLRGCIQNGSSQALRIRLVSQQQQLILSTESGQQQFPFGMIRDIRAHSVTTEGGKWSAWSVLEVQLATSAQSKVYIYWFPGQYVQNLKNIIFGF